MKICGLILAAGRSSRMGRDKALLEYRRDTFLNRQIYLMLPRVDELVVVLGHHADEILPTIPDAAGLRTTVNENYDVGMLSSLQAGLAAIGTDADWVLFALVDHPVVRGRTLDRLTQACRNSDATLVIPRFNGQRGHPVMLSRVVLEEIRALDPAASPQDVIRSHYGEALFVDANDRGVVTDVDLPEDYDLVTAP